MELQSKSHAEFGLNFCYIQIKNSQFLLHTCCNTYFLSYISCRILGLSLGQLRQDFDAEACDLLKHQSNFARNFLEYCCFLALARSIHINGYLDDNKFRRLTFDMMVAWEFPEAASGPFLHVRFFGVHVVGLIS